MLKKLNKKFIKILIWNFNLQKSFNGLSNNKSFSIKILFGSEYCGKALFKMELDTKSHDGVENIVLPDSLHDDE